MTASTLENDVQIGSPGIMVRLLLVLKGAVAGFFAAFQFLTIIPPVIRRSFTAAELGWSVAFFPLVGIILGGILLGLDFMFGQIFAVNLQGALVLACWVILTGALHLDGFLDTCDGLWGGKTPAERLAIMRDPRVGAFGVAGGILLMLLKFSALVSLKNRETALLVAPVLGRWSMSLAMVLFPYARSEGLGRAMKDNCGWIPGIIAAAAALPLAWWFGGEFGLFLLVPSGLLTLLTGFWLVRRVGGFTGDVYGFICEIIELAVLLALAVEIGE